MALLAPVPTDRDGGDPPERRDTSRVISGDLFDEELSRSIATESYDRCFHPAGTAFQLVAIAAIGRPHRGARTARRADAGDPRPPGLAGHPVGRRGDRRRRFRAPNCSSSAGWATTCPRSTGRRWPTRSSTSPCAARSADMPDLAERSPARPTREVGAAQRPGHQSRPTSTAAKRCSRSATTPRRSPCARRCAALYDTLDTEEVASSAGLSITVHEFTSAPDGNTIKIRYVRPERRRAAPVRLLHPRRRHAERQRLRCAVPDLGQGARRRGSRGRHGRLPQLRVTASSAPEVEPFPAGLNDCVSGLRWVVANAGELRIDPATGRSSPARAAAAT